MSNELDKLLKYLKKEKSNFKWFPLYMYCEGTGYVSKIEDAYDKEIGHYTDVRTSSSIKYAINFRNYSRKDRQQFLDKVNEAMVRGNYGIRFHFRRG